MAINKKANLAESNLDRRAFYNRRSGWGHFFSWGNFSPDFHDWADITAPRFQFLKKCSQNFAISMHISHPSALNYLTTRYLAIPDFIHRAAIHLAAPIKRADLQSR
jgi:hypothetical protein